MRVSCFHKSLMIAASICMFLVIPVSAKVYNYHPGELDMAADWGFESAGKYVSTIFSYTLSNNRIVINNKYGGAIYDHRLAYTWAAPAGEVIVSVNSTWSRYGYLKNYPSGNYWAIAWYSSSDSGAGIGDMTVDWSSVADLNDSRNQTYAVEDNVTKIGLGSLSTASDASHEVAFNYISITTEVLYEACAEEQYVVPANYADWSGNPMGAWTAAYAAYDWTTAGDWSAMVAGSQGGYSVFQHASYAFPSFGRYNSYWWISGRDDTSWGHDAGALIFTCPSDGLYSIVTDWAIYGMNGDAIVENNRVHLALDSVSEPTVLWETSVTIPATSQGVWHHDLSTVGALQEMKLPAGAMLIFEMNADVAAGYPTAVNKFLSTSSGTPGGYIKRVSYVDYDISSAFPGAQDCSVDLYDFAVLASTWLDCINADYFECAIEVGP